MSSEVRVSSTTIAIVTCMYGLEGQDVVLLLLLS